ncbi:hypothetical protein [Microbacterium sp. cx-59]|uniref:hypothetical protein n=1 Tax=Microbacterium sp. cx-59 TaxID=2891207 RepID=UPI001E40C887|nr:hypothetical protein [Microbacterium sp. cx-59]MCC4909458.1 hypothetical protein [Microbacterium sp. cx-59]
MLSLASSASTWADPAVVVQAAAVLVAAIAAIAVIWQAVLTRRALNEAARSMKIAQDSLAVAREAQSHASLMSVEAFKTRIAANAPSADLEARIDTLKFLAPSTVASGHSQPWPENHLFHIRDGSQTITARVMVFLRNTGSRATRFVLHGNLRQSVYKPGQAMIEMVGTAPGSPDVLLEPSESVEGYWEVTRTLDEWIAIYDARQSGEQGSETEFSAYVDDGHDTGAGYSFTLRMGGTAVRPSSAGLRETWVLTGSYDFPTEPDGIGIGRQPVTARYWLSKMQEQPLRDGPTEVVRGSR